jgi:DNA-binding transcriptional regulator YbjK
MANALNSPIGTAARSMLTDLDVKRETMKAHRERFIERRNQLMLELIRRAVARGEARATALTPRIASVGPALMRDHFLSCGAPIDDEVIAEIVDQVLVPLIRAV